MWLPPGYGNRNEPGYPVIYAHDGQNLFNPATSYAWIDWGIDETLGKMIIDREVAPAIVVGIWNSVDRYREYDPQMVFEEALTTDEQTEYAREFGLPLSTPYLRFIVEELKPVIDALFSTRPEQQSTFLLGSSMGGLISSYALCEYPDILRRCSRPVYPLARLLRQNSRLPDNSSSIRRQAQILLSITGPNTDDAPYEPFQKNVDNLLKKRGYIEGHDWTTLKFPGDEHSERAWRCRADIPLRFLLGT